MNWPIGTMVAHKFLGQYIVDGPSFVNEIGYLMVPVRDAKGIRHYFHPKNLKVSQLDKGRVEKGGIFKTPVKAKSTLVGESLNKKKAG